MSETWNIYRADWSIVSTHTSQRAAKVQADILLATTGKSHMIMRSK